MTEAAEKLEMTIPEFDAFVESGAEGKNFELFDGTPLLMSNPSETHEQIASNIGANLKLAMDKRDRRTYQGGIMVQAWANSAGRDKFRPDVVVRCGPSGNNTFITDPIVVVEVLSPSAIDRDRGPKLEFYRNLPTVQHVVLAYADQMRIEHYFRVENGWEMKVLPTPESILELDAVEFSMDLEAIYFDVPFEDAPGLGRGQGASAGRFDRRTAGRPCIVCGSPRGAAATRPLQHKIDRPAKQKPRRSRRGFSFSD